MLWGRKHWVILGLLVLCLVSGGCSGSGGGGGVASELEVGHVTVASLAVPTGVSCIRVAVSIDSSTIYRLFPVNPGQLTNLQITGLVPGDYLFTGDASADICPSDASTMGSIIYSTMEPTQVTVRKGQTSNMTLVFDPVPPSVQGRIDFEIPVSQTAGQEHRFYWLVGGQVFGAGEGEFLGDGTNLSRLHPVPILSLSGSGEMGKVVEIAAGRAHVCALRKSGEVYCLGGNNSGQLGDGTRTDRATAVQVMVPNPSSPPPALIASRIAAAYDQTCALTPDYELYCWGDGTQGNFGQDFGLGPTNSPRLVTPEAMLIQRVAMGSKHTCLLSTRGIVICAGSNAEGQLGNTHARSAGWFRVPVEAVTNLWAGGNNSCVVRADGEVSCWGAGPLGRSDTPAGSGVPVVLPALAGAKSIALGTGFGCAALPDSPPKCWGAGPAAAFGALGDGSGEAHSPIPVTGMGDAALMAAGGGTVYAIRPTGAAYGWGDNLFGQLGMGDLINRFTAERLLFCDPSVPSTCAY